MKCIHILTAFVLMVVACNTAVSAQEKKLHFELGANYPIGLQKDGFEENHIGLYLNGMYNLFDCPFDMNFKISYESYTVVKKSNSIDIPLNGRSISLIPSFNYHLNKTGVVQSYLGVGMGASVDNIEAGVFNEGHVCHFAVVPQAGVRIAKHIHAFAQYYITDKDFNRLMLGVGYIF